MAKVLKNIFSVTDEVQQTFTINAWHVSQSVDAFTGTEDYDITISGSLTTTGSIKANGLEDALGLPISLLGIKSDGEIITTGSSAFYSTDKLIATTRTDQVFSTAGSSNPFSFREINNSDVSGSFQFGNSSTFSFNTQTLDNDNIVIGSDGIYQLDLSTRLTLPVQNAEITYTLKVYDTPGGTLLNNIIIDRKKSSSTTTGTYAVDSFFGTYPLLQGNSIEIIFTLASNSSGTTLSGRSEVQIEKLS